MLFKPIWNNLIIIRTFQKYKLIKKINIYQSASLCTSILDLPYSFRLANFNNLDYDSDKTQQYN